VSVAFAAPVERFVDGHLDVGGGNECCRTSS
jgi:hypothetical protein